MTGDDDIRPSHVIGIGASAGGLESLERFFGAFPYDTGMAVVVLQHLAADHKTLMAGLLEKHTQMPVVVAADGTLVEPDHVYLLPPSHNLEIRDGRLVLTERMDALGNRPNCPIDQFFRSLALDCGERSVGIVLSGTGSDGSHGLVSINAAGGLALAEDPETAKFASMPRAAIQAGVVAEWTPAAELPEALLRHVGRLEQASEIPHHGLERIVTHVSRHVGVDFHAYKRATVGRRVDRRRAVTGSETINAYGDVLEQSPDECDRLAQDLLVGVTAFFRDPEVYAALESVLPDIVAHAAARSDTVVRAWVPGCSTGEEAYSLAMVLWEAIESSGVAVDLKIFATDVNTDALAVAGRGYYPLSIRANVSAERLRRFFTAEPEGYLARPFLREQIVFARHDILRDPPFTRLDLISCRNLLIYLDATAQRRVGQVFRFGLNPGGYLLLGQSESVSAGAAFVTVNDRARLYSMAKPARMQHDVAPAMPSLKRPPDPPSSPPERVPKRSLEGGSWLLERTLEHLGAPILVLNENADLAYAFGDIAQALRVPAGRAGWKAMDLLPAESAAVVSAAIARAKHLRQPVSVDDFSLESDGGHYRGSLRAIPLKHRGTDAEAVALFFDAPWEPSAASPISIDEAMRNRVQQLESELSRHQLQLQRAQEELETSTEELQATNEELVSSNEELQSTNEELQSVNEELHTVNAELQFKVEELSQLSTDLENLLRAVRGGLLFLDHQGRIRRYNEAVLDVLPLVPHDEGRPIGDIAHSLVDVDLGHEVERVVQTQIGYEREVRTRDRKTYSLSLQPFAHAEGGYEGVVLTLNDVSNLSEANDRLRTYLRLLDQSPAPTVVASPDGGIEFVNQAYASLTGLDGSALAGQSFAGLLHPSTEDAATAAITSVTGAEPWQGTVMLRTDGKGSIEARASVFAVVGLDGTTEQIAISCIVPV